MDLPNPSSWDTHCILLDQLVGGEHGKKLRETIEGCQHIISSM